MNTNSIPSLITIKFKIINNLKKFDEIKAQYAAKMNDLFKTKPRVHVSSRSLCLIFYINRKIGTH